MNYSNRTRMGYEGQLKYGNAGSTAGTLIQNCVDLNYDQDAEYGDTTTRGDSSAVPIQTQGPSQRKASITWKMLNKPEDAALIALLAASADQTPVALRTLSYSSGKGYDGDCYVKAKNGMPLKGEATYDFEAVVTDDGGRAPQLWV